jgi:hypothetical protein
VNAEHSTRERELERRFAVLRAEADRLRLRLAGEPVTAEFVGTPALTVDQQLRVAALHAAAQTWAGIIMDSEEQVLATASAFLAFLTQTD